MANFQLEDLLRDDKKDANLIPDLSKATCNSDEEFRRLMECVPEFKLKPEKVKKEDTKVRDKCFTFKTFTKKRAKAMRAWSYGNPIPPDMRSLNLQELQQVPIDWRMLTSLRPKLRQDEDMFSRLVEMGKLQLKSRARERRGLGIKSPVRRTKNKAGIIETTIRMCGDCGEEYCEGETCGDILYDSFVRVSLTAPAGDAKAKQPTSDAAAIIAGMDAKGKKKPKKKTALKKKKKIKKKAATETAGGESARLLARKAKPSGAKPAGGKTTAPRRESERSEGAKESEQPRKFRRKCSKYPAKRKNATTAK